MLSKLLRVARGETGKANEFSRLVAAAIDAERRRQSVSAPELVRRISLSESYYYKRMRGEAPFNTNDIQIIADALGVAPGELLRTVLAPVEARTAPLNVTVSRIRRLAAVWSPGHPDRDVVTDLSRHLARVVGGVDVAQVLSGGDEDTELSDAAITATAEFFEVPANYLRIENLAGDLERLDAQLEVDLALIEAGASRFATRASSTLDAPDLRHVAAAIRGAGEHQSTDNPSARM